MFGLLALLPANNLTVFDGGWYFVKLYIVSRFSDTFALFWDVNIKSYCRLKNQPVIGSNVSAAI